jgi:hypothetical protein
MDHAAPVGRAGPATRAIRGSLTLLPTPIRTTSQRRLQMRKKIYLLGFLAILPTACTTGTTRGPAQTAGAGQYQQQQQYPSQPQPSGQTTQPAAAQPAAAQPAATVSQPAANSQVATVPAGSFDAQGAMTSQFIRQEPSAVLAELIAALPEALAAKVRGIPLLIDDTDPKDVNAFAACTKSGPVVAITYPLALVSARTSEARAYDELFGTARYEQLSQGIADEVKQQKAIAGPPAGFLALPQALDARKLARQRLLFDEQIAFILGHELAHHYRGHTGCANGASQQLTVQDIGRVLSDAVPVFNQPNEIDADVQGTFNFLDAGARRQSGKWTEEGSVMSLSFFSRLGSLGVETVLLGFLTTHPLPQIRLPIVQTAAAQWRSNGGKAPAFPLPLTF